MRLESINRANEEIEAFERRISRNRAEREEMESRDSTIAALRAQLAAQEAESVRLYRATTRLREAHGRDAKALGLLPCQCPICDIAANPRTALLVAVIDAAIKYRDAERTIEGKVMDFSIGWAVMQPVMRQLADAVDALRAFDAGKGRVNG